MNFTDFNFKPVLENAVKRAGFTEPSPIQKMAIPLILEGQDVVGQAHTGTGKTAAFALPVLEKIQGNGDVEVVALVPTRELAMQVADEFYKFSRTMKIRTATVYGGTSYRRQIDRIGQAGIIVATPGRLLDLLSSKKIELNPDFLILDEADEMLNMGFLEDVRRIESFFPNRKQTLLFSATMPDEIKDLANTIQKNPQFVRAEQTAVTKNSIEQYYYVVDEHERDDAVVRLLDHTNPDKAIIFCRTKKETSRVAEFLNGQGYKTEALHGDIEQWDRQKTMKGFRRNQFDILVATDVASRGIDVRGVTHVFNYHIPFDSESYVHRIGRTGRAERDGVAMTLVTPHEFDELSRIENEVGSDLHFKVIPAPYIDPQLHMLKLTEMIADKKVGKDAHVLLSKVSQGFSTQVIAEKLLMLVADSLVIGDQLGKTQDQVEELKRSLDLAQAQLQSSKRKSSGRRRSSSSSGRNRGRSSGNSSRSRGQARGRNRSDRIPTPDISTTSSGARIVARKLY